ncbi:MAG: CoA transferase [Deltaproteobacteria bacterium]|nr:CoA transferase [Deltaproteobacteria bacterium]
MTTTKPSQMPSPLQGVRVVDLSRLLPGPFATQLMVDLGAEVIKVEDPKGGDYLRYFLPLAKDGTSVLFHAINRGKKSCALNLKLDEDRNAFLTLIEEVDVVVESFRPGVMAKLGLGADVLLERNPRLVVCSISGYGQTGAHAMRAGHDLNYVARAGVLGMTSTKSNPSAQIADYAGGAWPAVTQILAALIGRGVKGAGCHIDVDMTAGARSLLTLPLASAWYQDKELLPDDNVLAGAVPCYGIYETRDGQLSVGALETHFWQRFVAVLYENDDAADPDLAQKGLCRNEEGAAVRQEVQRILSTRTTDEWMQDFAKTDACVEPVYSPTDEETHDIPVAKVELEGETLKLPMAPLSIGNAVQALGPALGEHNKMLFKNRE